MFSKHVTKELSAYCHGEVTNEQSRQIAEHLIGCSRCRAQFEEVKLGVKLAEHLPQLSAPDSLWLDLQTKLASDTRTNKSTAPGRKAFSFKLWQPGFAAVAAGLLIDTEVTDLAIDGFDLVLRHRLLPFVSYPFECATCTRLPSPPFRPANITRPLPIVCTGVPTGAP